MLARRIFAITAVALLSGCMAKGDARKADAAEAAFYQQVAAHQYEAIYSAGAPELRNALPPEAFIGMMSRIDRKMGPCQAPTKRMDWRVNATTNGFFRTQGYTRTCANGVLTETVTTVTRDGQAKIAGYYASNPLLLTD
jgi:hypothetical protein